MGSVNKVILVGNLGADPELKYTPSNRAVCNLSVATNEVWKDKSGQKQEKTEWHRVTVWGEQAENCSKFLSKGRMVYVEGRLQTRSWDDKEGKKRYSTEVVADRVVFLGGGAGAENGGGGGGRRAGGGRPGWGEETSRRPANPPATGAGLRQRGTTKFHLMGTLRGFASPFGPPPATPTPLASLGLAKPCALAPAGEARLRQRDPAAVREGVSVFVSVTRKTHRGPATLC